MSLNIVHYVCNACKYPQKLIMDDYNVPQNDTWDKDRQCCHCGNIGDGVICHHGYIDRKQCQHCMVFMRLQSARRFCRK